MLSPRTKRHAPYALYMIFISIFRAVYYEQLNEPNVLSVCLINACRVSEGDSSPLQ